MYVRTTMLDIVHVSKEVHPSRLTRLSVSCDLVLNKWSVDGRLAAEGSASQSTVTRSVKGRYRVLSTGQWQPVFGPYMCVEPGVL